MLLTHKLRLDISSYSFLETAIVICGFVFVGYMVDPSDPALINYEISYLIVVLAIVTLFHGVANGLFSLLLLAAFMEYFYPSFPVQTFLKISVLVLIFGEFHYYWNRKILQNSSKNSYLSIKLDELSNAFYTLKISHDQLEKNYVFKPMSIRNSIRQLKDAFIDKNDYYENFLLLLEKSFNVSDAEFCMVKGKKLYSAQSTETKKSINSSDPMIEMALSKKTPIYVSSEKVENNSSYLAVIPVVTQNDVKAMLLIKKMPFMSFNKDNLISISIIIAYFLEEIEKGGLIAASDHNPLVDDDFYFELQRLNKIYQEFEVNSTILVIKTPDALLAHRIGEFILENLRSLDMVTRHEADEVKVVGMLFPFADQASAKGFLTRLFKLLKLDSEDEKVEFSLFDISELKIANEYAGIKSNDA